MQTFPLVLVPVRGGEASFGASLPRLKLAVACNIRLFFVQSFFPDSFSRCGPSQGKAYLRICFC